MCNWCNSLPRHGRKSTGVINNSNDGSDPFKCLVKVTRHAQLKPKHHYYYYFFIFPAVSYLKLYPPKGGSSALAHVLRHPLCPSKRSSARSFPRVTRPARLCYIALLGSPLGHESIFCGWLRKHWAFTCWHTHTLRETELAPELNQWGCVHAWQELNVGVRGVLCSLGLVFSLILHEWDGRT